MTVWDNFYIDTYIREIKGSATFSSYLQEICIVKKIANIFKSSSLAFKF